ncbi:MAG: alpha/beta hydrolase [Pirellulaceae bacterium]
MEWLRRRHRFWTEMFRLAAVAICTFCTFPLNAQTQSEDATYLKVNNIDILVVAPAQITPTTPLIFLYHGFGKPASPEQLREVLPPIEGAVCVYPSIPESPARLPEGGVDELVRRQKDNYVSELLSPILDRVVPEYDEAVDVLTEQFELSDQRPIALMGFSVGGLICEQIQLHATHHPSRIVLVNSPLTIEEAIKNWEHHAGKMFSWNEKARSMSEDILMFAEVTCASESAAGVDVLILRSDSDAVFTVDSAKQILSESNADSESEVNKHVMIIELTDSGHNPFSTPQDDDSKNNVVNTIQEFLKGSN